MGKLFTYIFRAIFVGLEKPSAVKINFLISFFGEEKLGNYFGKIVLFLGGCLWVTLN
jgi:hypothetical protein